jgi:hypothetical protein
MESLKAIVLCSLSQHFKAAEKKEHRDFLKPGTYNVDFTVHVSGKVSIGKDAEKTPTVSIPLKETLALFIQYSGVTRDAAIDVLRRAMTDALKNDTKGRGAIAELDIVNPVFEEVVENFLKELPKVPQKGPVDCKRLQVEVTDEKKEDENLLLFP